VEKRRVLGDIRRNLRTTLWTSKSPLDLAFSEVQSGLTENEERSGESKPASRPKGVQPGGEARAGDLDAGAAE
jgi:hypothetical protein